MMYRLARVSDSVRITAVINANLDDYFSQDVIEFFLMQWPGGQVVATDMFGNITGAICGSVLGNGAASVSLFAVDYAYRNQGVGTKLLETFRTRCFMEGHTAIQLEVRTSNSNAIRFYRKNGFSVTETLYGFYSDGGDAYRMMCRIGLSPRASS